MKFLTWRRGQWRENRPSPGWPTAGTLSNTMAVFLHLLLHFPLTFPVEPSHLYCTYTYTDWLTSTSLSCLFLKYFTFRAGLPPRAAPHYQPSDPCLLIGSYLAQPRGHDNVAIIFIEAHPSTKPDTVEIDADLTYLIFTSLHLIWVVQLPRVGAFSVIVKTDCESDGQWIVCSTNIKVHTYFHNYIITKKILFFLLLLWLKL